jgi:hypothetical protein
MSSDTTVPEPQPTIQELGISVVLSGKTESGEIAAGSKDRRKSTSLLLKTIDGGQGSQEYELSITAVAFEKGELVFANLTKACAPCYANAESVIASFGRFLEHLCSRDMFPEQLLSEEEMF